MCKWIEAEPNKQQAEMDYSSQNAPTKPTQPSRTPHQTTKAHGLECTEEIIMRIHFDNIITWHPKHLAPKTI